MRAAEPLQPDLRPEWERIERLAACLEALRRGETVAETRLGDFERICAEARAVREAGGWADLVPLLSPKAAPEIGHHDLDILACVLAPEAVGRLAWTYQRLQPGIPEPYPTRALLHDLLMLDTDEDQAFFARLCPTSPLFAGRLIMVEGEGPMQILRPSAALIERVLRRAARFGPPPGATTVPGEVDWNDLVLPPLPRRLLQEFLLWIRHRERVGGEWRGRLPGGPLALFAGPSGAGKTLAAAVLAQDLGWPLYRLNLGDVVSKYVGETEKNLNRLLDALHGARAVLQIDEADALFGKRGEVRDARDRYANMEISHLLSRIELHQGPVILTTNLRANIDDAFLRRFQMVVDFPQADAVARTELWRRLLPPGAPRAEDVDFRQLGHACNLSGGAIRNAALHAAFLAAEADEPVAARHIAIAVWRELNKENRPIRRTELGALARHLPREIAA